jgi:hypothetical protein
LGEFLIVVVVAIFGVGFCWWMIQKGEKDDDVSEAPHLPAITVEPQNLPTFTTDQNSGSSQRSLEAAVDSSKLKKKSLLGSLKTLSQKEISPKLNTENLSDKPPSIKRGFSLPAALGIFPKIFKPRQKNEVKKALAANHFTPGFQAPLADAADPIGTASLKTVPWKDPTAPNKFSSPKLSESKLSELDQKFLDREVEISSELAELKERYQKIESMLSEKNEEIDRLQMNLNVELSNKKEFNKIKDVLEKEIKEGKERIRENHAEFNTTKTELDNSKKRVHQLEEKIVKFEKEILITEREVQLLADKLKLWEAQKLQNSPVNPLSSEVVHSTLSPALNENITEAETPEEKKSERGVSLAEPLQNPHRESNSAGDAKKSVGEELAKSSSEPNEILQELQGNDKNSSEEIGQAIQENDSNQNTQESAESSSQDSGFLKLRPDVVDDPENLNKESDQST